MPNTLEPTEPPDDCKHDTNDTFDDSIEPENLRFFTRSPHPYHRSDSIRNATRPKLDILGTDIDTTHSAPNKAKEQGDKDQDATTLAWKELRKSSNTSSDSGSEADDERFTVARALPAPPVRPRKGLREDTLNINDGSVSPLYSPAQVDEDAPKFEPEYFGLKKGKAVETSEESEAARQRYLRRRRAEVIRRSTEVCLMGSICAIVAAPTPVRECMVSWYRVELLSYISIVPILSFVYFARILLFHSNRHGNVALPPGRRIRIPAAFDPATLLYPVLLPVMVTLSIAPSSERALLANIILGLSAIPARLLPFGRDGSGYNVLHWFMSIIPLIASEWTAMPNKIHASKPYLLKMPPPDGLTPDILASLYALHQALLPALHYLTTTSLLPAELQLLSVAMINLLLFSASPQTIILAVALWTGGLGIFILCGHVLSWGVALARIPRWRFRRAGKVIEARQTFIQTVTEKLKKPRIHNEKRRDSDTEDEHEQLLPSPRQLLRLNTQEPRFRNGSIGQHDEPKSALVQTGPDHFFASRPKRSNTLPDMQAPATTLRPSRPSLRRRPRPSLPVSFSRLTPNEANLRKWIYALYFYAAIVLIFCIPLRILVSKYALNDQEPLGWALGYLVEGIPEVRSWVMTLDLESHIPIQRFITHSEPSSSLPLGLAQHLRLNILGEANTRLLLAAYCLLIVSLGLLIVLTLPSHVEVDTRRKVFHGTMVFLLLPTIPIDPAFISLALSVILAIFLLLDLIRASQLPPLSKPLARFLTPYVDGRDLRGPVVVSHIFLLIGCAIPLWLSLGGMERSGSGSWQGWEVEGRSTSMLAGVVCVGMGDAAASLIGRRFGRRKWPWAGGKSLEGSAAFAAAVVVGLMFGKVWLRFGGWEDLSGEYLDLSSGLDVVEETRWFAVAMGKAVVSACGASLMEAVLTGGNDNVIVPVVLWLLVRGLNF